MEPSFLSHRRRRDYANDVARDKAPRCGVCPPRTWTLTPSDRGISMTRRQAIGSCSSVTCARRRSPVASGAPRTGRTQRARRGSRVYVHGMTAGIGRREVGRPGSRAPPAARIPVVSRAATTSSPFSRTSAAPNPPGLVGCSTARHRSRLRRRTSGRSCWSRTRWEDRRRETGALGGAARMT